MKDLVDLHIHSDRSSDGDYPPARIIRLAKNADFRAISIADHDTVAAYPEAIHRGNEEGLEVIPGIELTTVFEEREFHLLLPFVEWDNPVLLSIVEEVAERRRAEAKERVEKLQRIGFDIQWEEVLEVSDPFPPLGVTIAQVVLNKAERKGLDGFEKYLRGKNRLFAPYNFYRDFFVEGKPAAVPKKNISLLTVLEKVPETGGVPVLAHPGADFQKTLRRDLVRLKECGLQGIEVYSTYHEKEQIEYYLQWAHELDLVPTAGSDFHGSIKPHVPFGKVKEGRYWMVEELKKRRAK
jgi:predicted metal-dependent phosphoesterase TrpH